MNVKKKRRWWPSKGFWWGEQFREINTTFFQMFRSIWVSALEFGRKSTAEVILLLCLWKIISRPCWGGFQAGDWLIDVQIYETIMELWNCYGWKRTPKVMESNTWILFGNRTLILLLNPCYLRAGGWGELWDPIPLPPWEGSTQQHWLGNLTSIIGRKLK